MINIQCIHQDPQFRSEPLISNYERFLGHKKHPSMAPLTPKLDHFIIACDIGIILLS